MAGLFYLHEEFDRAMNVILNDVSVANRYTQGQEVLPAFFEGIVDDDVRNLVEAAKQLAVQDPSDIGQVYDNAKAALDLVAAISEEYMELALRHSDVVDLIGQMPAPVYDDLDI